MARKFGKVRQRTDSGSWYVDARPYGRIQWIQVEDVGRKALDRGMADMLLSWIRASIAAGKSPKAAVDPYLPKPTATVGQRARAWVESIETKVRAGERSPNYLRQVRRAADSYFTPLDEVSIYGLDYGIIEDWLEYLVALELGPATRQTIARHLRAFLGWLHQRREIVAVPPFPAVLVPPRVPKTVDAQTQDAIVARIEPAAQGGLIAAVELLLRPGEVRALNVEDYDRRTRVLTIAHAMKGEAVEAVRRETKTYDIRCREASDRLHAWIEEHVPVLAVHAGERPLFPNPSTGRRWSHHAIWTIWRHAAGPDGPSLYEGTKHSTATALRAAGVPLDVIQKAAGHKSPRSTERYAHLPEAVVRDALRRRR